ncbi:MAG TPA: TonB-dependent receptor [Candidatus Eremiobacteraceae bacterium]|nr:TonB-dependent receptor [Candidatus Eremiobacteraceae bacterium]
MLAGVAAALIAAPAQAGTTGGISGRVFDASTHQPLAGVKVEAVSPSAQEVTTSDPRGDYFFVSLPPDTYAIAATKDGYAAFQQQGITIQADTQLRLDIGLTANVKVLGHVVTRSAGDLVRPGQTIDVYSINPSTANAAKPLSGPGGVDQAYGSLATVAGIYVPQGQQGWYQPIYIRGGDQDQIGYELDGVPVNRSYDNAPESLLTDVGQQELQVYTGGASASSNGQGISGYINQVVKRGTYPSFGSATYGLGFPAGYQKGALEFGDALPSGRFSYYVAGSIADQHYRYVDPFNGVSLDNSGFFFPSFQFNSAGNDIDLPGITLGASETRDHEALANIHYKPNSADDVQLLYLNSDLHTFTYGSLNDFGGAATFGAAFAYPDQYVYTGPVDQPINVADVSQYLFPNTPDTDRSYQSVVNPNLRAVADNGFSLTKLQYQHDIGSKAYIQALGFSTYSDWIISDPIPVPSTLLYVLPEITFGGGLNVVDQLNDKNLLTVSGSVASSREYRWTSGYDFLLGGGFTANGLIGGNYLSSVLIGSYTDGTHCYNATNGAYDSCFDPNSQVYFNENTGVFPALTPAPSGPAVTNGAQFVATENGLGGLINQVSPILTAGSIDDRIEASDRLTLDAGARVEHYDDRLVSELNGYPARQFWFNAWNNEYCVGQNLTLIQRTIDPDSGVASPCPSGSGPIHLSPATDPDELNSVFEPRLSATYTLSADGLLRASYGTYARPPNASWVEYGTLQQDLATQLATKFLPYGFTTPQHDLLPDVSHNVDLSWEQRIPSLDASFKITPYYRGVMGQFENILLDTSGDESGVNVGNERSFGVELALQKGDFARQGLSGLLALTYDDSRFTYAKFASGFNVIDLNNHQIETYNAYTSACAPGGSAANETQYGSPVCGTTSSGAPASPCYTSTGAADPTCASGDTTNTYYTMPVQPLQNPNGSYAPYDVIPDEPFAAGNGFGPPVSGTFLLQYKHSRFTATPSVTYSSGAFYGTPLAMEGADPATSGNSIAIPDPFTGQFDKMGAFQQPWRLTGNLGLGYALTSRATLDLTMANLFDSCHQRGYAWDQSQFCVYTTLPFDVAPQSNGNDPNYQFPYTVQNGNNNTQFLGTTLPFQAYLTLQVKM